MALPVGTVHPEPCPVCGEQLVLKNGSFGMFYGCSAWPDTRCKGGGNAQKDGSPYGRVAVPEVRQLRRKCHAVFDRLWEEGTWKRRKAYKWLTKRLRADSRCQVPKEGVHFGYITHEATLVIAIATVVVHGYPAASVPDNP